MRRDRLLLLNFLDLTWRAEERRDPLTLDAAERVLVAIGLAGDGPRRGDSEEVKQLALERDQTRCEELLAQYHDQKSPLFGEGRRQLEETVKETVAAGLLLVDAGRLFLTSRGRAEASVFRAPAKRGQS